jgi:nucleotide-binding universal stress UspA family protein
VSATAGAPIAHATDATGDDALAFLHAAALAAASGTPLVSVHAEVGGVIPPVPDAAALATRWGKPIDHRRHLHRCCEDVTDTVLDALKRTAPGVVVTGTHARSGFGNLLRGSIGEAIARGVTVPTLIVPNHGRSFVDAATGALGLHVVLVPAADRAAATVGLAAARQLLALAGVATEPTRVVLGHVGATAHDLEDLGVEVMNVPGDVVDGVVALATMIDADLVVMPTHGHDAVLDAVRGSTTERVTRRLGRPLLSVPLPT